MIVQMDKTLAVSTSWERAQKIFDKNVELKNKRMNSVQARVPSDPNAWYRMRDNLEDILLEDYDFSEKHGIELELWQMHYKKIEEFRAHFSAAHAPVRSSSSSGGKIPAQPDRIMKIRVQLKAFLSEATGFYHDLILKIKAKYGLPLGMFSEGSDNHIDGVKSSEVKKGLMSCHRCLIYLGDLARYKGMYGEGESRNRDYAAASSYYLQAASLCPYSGNPHHQLAILASYSGDELAVVYRYFRSLAAEMSFSTAKDNLVVAFEKNRQRYSQLVEKAKASSTPHSGGKTPNGNLGKEVNLLPEGRDESIIPPGERSSSLKERYKEFGILFVRLNGMLFTRTSLEMFTDVLSSVRSALYELLSFGQEEERTVGTDAGENGLTILRLVTNLIFTINNVNKKSEGLTFAEIIQHRVLIQNAFTAAFELVGLLMERCLQLRDPPSSFLLPGILVFLEWLAGCPDVASCADMEEKTIAAKSLFWKQCIALSNNLLSTGLVSMDDEGDETCFTNMSRYNEGDCESQLALWEDFELRGFLPLLPAHSILDFSRKRPIGTDGSSKERKARIKRLVASCKSLSSVAMIDQKPVYYDSKAKKFFIGTEPQLSSDSMLSSYVKAPESLPAKQEISHGIMNTRIVQTKDPVVYEEDDDDEEIVFRPMPTDRPGGADGISWTLDEKQELGQNVATANNCIDQHTSAIRPKFTALAGNSTQPQQVVIPCSTTQLMEQQANPMNGFNSLSFVENGQMVKPEIGGGFDISRVTLPLPPIQQPSSLTNSVLSSVQSKAPEMGMPSKTDLVAYPQVGASSLAGNVIPTMSAASRSQVVRPGRHHGPPPGFNRVPSKQAPVPGSDGRNENILADDYRWLDGFSSSLSSGTGPESSINNLPNGYPQFVKNSNSMTGATSFPFPGKQLSPEQQHIVTGNQQFTHYRGQPNWTGRYFV